MAGKNGLHVEALEIAQGMVDNANLLNNQKEQKVENNDWGKPSEVPTDPIIPFNVEEISAIKNYNKEPSTKKEKLDKTIYKNQSLTLSRRNLSFLKILSKEKGLTQSEYLDFILSNFFENMTLSEKTKNEINLYQTLI